MATFTDPAFLERLTATLLRGPWQGQAIMNRAWYEFTDDRVLIEKVVRIAWAEFGSGRPTRKTLARFLEKTLSELPHEPDVRQISLDPPTMSARWPVPVLATTGQVADWLKISVNQLDWLADIKGLTNKQPEPRLRHYVHVRTPKRRGKSRLLEIPKGRLKAIQRRILHEILDAIPPHDAAHGFRAGRSIVSYVRAHVGQTIVLRFDLRDFFPSISAARVQAIFRSAGYPPTVARTLAALCTTRTPDDVVAEPRWRSRHLPQGAPTSPALANLSAYRLDVRLQSLAKSLDASYTRYADDLAFSGGKRLARAADRLQVLIAVIAAEEGFELNFRKSRFMRQSVRQQLAGIVVNVRPNLRRAATTT